MSRPNIVVKPFTANIPNLHISIHHESGDCEARSYLLDVLRQNQTSDPQKSTKKFISDKYVTTYNKLSRSEAREALLWVGHYIPCGSKSIG